MRATSIEDWRWQYEKHVSGRNGPICTLGFSRTSGTWRPSWCPRSCATGSRGKRAGSSPGVSCSMTTSSSGAEGLGTRPGPGCSPGWRTVEPAREFRRLSALLRSRKTAGTEIFRHAAARSGRAPRPAPTRFDHPLRSQPHRVPPPRPRRQRRVRVGRGSRARPARGAQDGRPRPGTVAAGVRGGRAGRPRLARAGAGPGLGRRAQGGPLGVPAERLWRPLRRGARTARPHREDLRLRLLSPRHRRGGRRPVQPGDPLHRPLPRPRSCPSTAAAASGW